MTEPMTTMRLWVDFNEIESEQYVEADLEFAGFFLERDLVVGQEADLFDGAGHECGGTIIRVDRPKGIVGLVIDWQTWTSPARRRTFELAVSNPLALSTWDWSPREAIQ